MDYSDFIIRSIKVDDLDWLFAITKTVGAGLTSLQPNIEYCTKRVDTAVKSFADQIPNEKKIFLFVMEHLPTKANVGLCGIDVDVGHRDQFYNYQISTVSQSNKKLNLFIDHHILRVVNNYQKASELISFWINPEFRQQRLSRPLSLSRFVFMAQHVELFGSQVIAEIRGVVSSDGHSPFWNAVGKNFFKMEFKKADYLSVNSGKQFISDLISREPIYIDLLPEEAKAVIGVPHPNSEGARYILEQEGLKYNRHIDVFDAGPLIDAELNTIQSFKNSRLSKIAKIMPTIEATQLALIYNCSMDARIMYMPVIIDSNEEICITSKTADQMQLSAGDQIRYCIIREKSYE